MITFYLPFIRNNKHVTRLKNNQPQAKKAFRRVLINAIPVNIYFKVNNRNTS